MNTDYPRMLFHKTRKPVTVHSREEEDALGAEWSRVIRPAEEPQPKPAQQPLRKAAALPPAPPQRKPEAGRRPAVKPGPVRHAPVKKKTR